LTAANHVEERKNDHGLNKVRIRNGR
jgi:hypothetical protein